MWGGYRSVGVLRRPSRARRLPAGALLQAAPLAEARPGRTRPAPRSPANFGGPARTPGSSPLLLEAQGTGAAQKDSPPVPGETPREHLGRAGRSACLRGTRRPRPPSAGRSARFPTLPPPLQATARRARTHGHTEAHTQSRHWPDREGDRTSVENAELPCTINLGQRIKNKAQIDTECVLPCSLQCYHNSRKVEIPCPHLMEKQDTVL